MNTENATATFWEHLDALRGSLWKIAAVVTIFGCIAFFFKDYLFAFVLAPKNSDFITFRLLGETSNFLSPNGADSSSFSVNLINTQLAEQFTIHIKMAISAGFLAALPYVLYEIYRFVSPALYASERRYAVRVVASSYAMFMIGAALSYFLVFPLTFRFLGTYQVSPEVENLIVLGSYIDMLTMLCMAMGIVFEIPVLSWFFARMGFITASFLRRYRRHAVVVLLFIAALITPTADVVTLLLVAFPMHLLYEISIFVAKRATKSSVDS